MDTRIVINILKG